MQIAWKSKRRKLHARNIEVTIYDYDGQRIIVEGSLKDERFQKINTVIGETIPSGVIHNMSIRLLVNCSNLLIEDVDVDLISVPRAVCRETIECLAPIKGLTVTKGFTLKVKKLAGGNRGCTHLMELLMAMAPAVFQGFAAYQSQKSSGFDQDHAKMIAKYLINTCHAWREDGPFVEVFKRKFNIKS